MKIPIKKILLILAINNTCSLAASTSVEITGEIFAEPCKFTNNNSELKINLGNNIFSTSLASAGSGSQPIPFKLELTECPLGVSHVTATFNGNPDNNIPTMYKNIGDATNLAIEVSDITTGKIIGNNESIMQPIDINRSVTYLLSSRVYTEKGNVNPGSINSLVQVTFTYN